jgi:four helix bundle protein
MISQIRRAATSVPANIAEGHARAHTKEYLYQLSVAKGSLAELETLLILSSDVELLREEDLHRCLQPADEISRMLAALRTSLERRLQS